LDWVIKKFSMMAPSHPSREELKGFAVGLPLEELDLYLHHEESNEFHRIAQVELTGEFEFTQDEMAFAVAKIGGRVYGSGRGRLLGRMTLNPLAHFDLFGTLLLVDDSDAFLDTLVGDALSAAVRAAPAGLAAVVAGSSDDLPLTYRGIAAEVRRSRCALVLQPGPGDGDLVGRRLPQRRGVRTAGRGVLIGDGAWGAGFTAEPIPIQVALS